MRGVEGYAGRLYGRGIQRIEEGYTEGRRGEYRG